MKVWLEAPPENNCLSSDQIEEWDQKRVSYLNIPQ